MSSSSTSFLLLLLLLILCTAPLTTIAEKHNSYSHHHHRHDTAAHSSPNHASSANGSAILQLISYTGGDCSPQSNTGTYFTTGVCVLAPNTTFSAGSQQYLCNEDGAYLIQYVDNACAGSIAQITSYPTECTVLPHGKSQRYTCADAELGPAVPFDTFPPDNYITSSTCLGVSGNQYCSVESSPPSDHAVCSYTAQPVNECVPSQMTTADGMPPNPLQMTFCSADSAFLGTAFFNGDNCTQSSLAGVFLISTYCANSNGPTFPATTINCTGAPFPFDFPLMGSYAVPNACPLLNETYPPLTQITLTANNTCGLSGQIYTCASANSTQMDLVMYDFLNCTGSPADDSFTTNTCQGAGASSWNATYFCNGLPIAI